MTEQVYTLPMAVRCTRMYRSNVLKRVRAERFVQMVQLPPDSHVPGGFCLQVVTQGAATADLFPGYVRPGDADRGLVCTLTAGWHPTRRKAGATDA